MTPATGKLATRLGTATVRDAVRYGMATLTLPVANATAARYNDTTTMLDQIANNKVEQY